MHSGFHCNVNMQEVWSIFIYIVDIIMLYLFLSARSQSLFYGKRNDEPLSLVEVQLTGWTLHVLFSLYGCREQWTKMEKCTVITDGISI